MALTQPRRLIAHAAVLTALIAVLAALFALAAPTAAQTRLPPQGFADLAEKLMPAVVNIATSQRLEGVGPSPKGPGSDPFGDLLGPEGGLGDVNSLGSGFVITAEGLVVTNNHVIEGATQIDVIFQSGQRLSARVVGRDPVTDIALLRVNAGRPLPFVRWGDATRARVGDLVIAIGNPFGLGGSVSAGIISARNRNIDAGRYDDFIQTDAAINRGNSGGPLFNINGEVIGVNTAIVSPTGASVGVGFATPSDLASRVVSQLAQFGETRRGWLGVRIGVVNPEVARRAGLTEPRGALITSITPDSPAGRAGLQINDIVLAFNNQAIVEARQLTRLVAEAQINSVVNLTILRGAKQEVRPVTILRLQESLTQVRTPTAPGDGVDLPPNRAMEGRVMGMVLAEITPALRGRFSLAPDARGLVVLSVDASSDAARKVQQGDVILNMQFTAVTTVAQAQRVAEQISQADRPVLINLMRGRDLTFRSVRAGRSP
jgi:serine protease Do